MTHSSSVRRWLKQPLCPHCALSRESALFLLILLLAAITRFYALGERVMSHDESLHTYFSWTLSQGQGYQHTPMMHGPFQFHVIALFYFLFGASDFTARIPAALMSIATIAVLWQWRRYLGRAGTLVTAFLFVISPYMLYYGRYVRNEAYVGLFGIVMLYAILRYLQDGQLRHLYLLTLVTTLHFASKETSFIYVAQALLFLGAYLLAETLNQPAAWLRKTSYRPFVLTLILAALLGALGLTITTLRTLALATAVFALALAAGLLIYGYGWRNLKQHPSFNLILVLSTLTLPQLAPLPLHLLGWTVPTDALQLQALTLPELLRFGIVLGVFILLSVGLGLAWDARHWPIIAGIFYGIFLVLYTTVLTNGAGFFSGMVGSLGYWLAQQSVQRGGQPWYYYLLIQIPMYEFLPAIGFWLAAWLGWKHRPRPRAAAAAAPTEEPATSPEAFSHPLADAGAAAPVASSPRPLRLPGHTLFVLLIGWWVVSSTLAYTIAGERMPWLTYHITLPMLLLTGWALGQLIEGTRWEAFRQRENWLPLLLAPILVIAGINTLRAWTAPTPPFSGQTLWALQATSNFLLTLFVLLLALGGTLYFWPRAERKTVARAATLGFFAILAALTMRASFRASYITYDQATEYLVYAHSARGVKDVMAQVEEISFRLYGDKSIALAYDASPPDTGISWPFSWYLRDYTNVLPFSDPDNTLRERDIILVDAKNFGKIESVLRDQYYRFDYIRMWWPNQDYFFLVSDRDPSQPFAPDYACQGWLGFLQSVRSKDFGRICNALRDPEIRAGLFDIWLNRDYTRYANATGQPAAFSLSSWQPADPMRMYIRKDIVARLWPYGVQAQPLAETDPYADGMISLSATRLVYNNNQFTFNAPRGLALAPDGSLYVADSLNHRILHLSANGELLGVIGSFGTAEQGLGFFNEPWDVAIAPDGSIYVADTWNHRIQKFSPEGQPLTAWGYWGQDGSPLAFYGPRSLAIGPDGRVFISDTGNKRIVVFDAEGTPLAIIGSGGIAPGQFDEPVGIAVDANGWLYVADTWNQRVQVFAPQETEGDVRYLPVASWNVDAWYGQSAENKPFIAVSDDGNLFISDPEGYRILQFSTSGEFLRGWGQYGIGADSFNLPAGLAIDAEGQVWVSDAGNHRLMRFAPNTLSEDNVP